MLGELLLEEVVISVSAEFRAAYGTIPGARFAILGLGKLGSNEMTFGSDMDLVFLYDVQDLDAVSDGEKGFTASVYYSRLTQRILTALTTMGKEGRLYEVDTRLRPSGKQGLAAVSIGAMRHYFDEMAWTFEFMALTKARPVAGDMSLGAELAELVAYEIGKPRDAVKLKADVADMRERVAKELPAKTIWNLKYARGGLMDMDFICQYLLLRYAHEYSLTGGSSEHVLLQLNTHNLLPAHVVQELLTHNTFLVQLLNILRLSSPEMLDEQTAMPGLKKLLSTSLQLPDFASLKEALSQVENAVHAHYIAIVAS
jgi:[glutamine synthetase] adenylyltransferase / [glutamine synthetase]-adenylyl-L-tyrosine phosphorylase